MKEKEKHEFILKLQKEVNKLGYTMFTYTNILGYIYYILTDGEHVCEVWDIEPENNIFYLYPTSRFRQDTKINADFKYRKRMHLNELNVEEINESLNDSLTLDFYRSVLGNPKEGLSKMNVIR